MSDNVDLRQMSYQEIKQLLRSKDEEISILAEECRFLECLEAAGVDNWGGYEVAQEMMDEQ